MEELKESHIIEFQGLAPSLRMGIYSILSSKAGAFVPLDPGFPLDRVEDILAQVAPRWALIGSRFVDLWREKD